MLRQSIEAKQQAEEDALRLSFVLQKEKQEAERKRIEAQGIIAPLLEWKGIEATEKLAASNNSRIVIIGNTENGLPLVFEPHGRPQSVAAKGFVSHCDICARRRASVCAKTASR